MIGKLAALPRWSHFAAGGALLFLVRLALPEAGEPLPAIRVPAARIAALSADFAGSFGRPPGEEELRGLIDQEVDDRLLEDEARRLRLDYGDRAIEQRLVLKMRAIAEDPGAGEGELLRRALELGLDDDVVIRRQLREKMRLFLAREPRPPFSRQELEAGYARHAERFRRPAAYGFTQIFLGAELHPDARAAALALRQAIAREGLDPAAAARRGDAFPLAASWQGQSQAEIARRFGAPFAAAVARLGSGEWSQAVASPFGFHLIFLHQKEEGGLPPLPEVEGQLRPLLEEERTAALVARRLGELRRLYRVEIGGAAGDAG